MARKVRNIHYIYKTTCNVTGKWYVGMHSAYTLEDGYMGSGRILKRSIRKYGVEKHTKEILEFCDSKEALVFRESEIVTKELISDGKCMNLKEGGCGGFISYEISKRGGDALKNKLEQDLEFSEKHRKIVSNNMKQLHLDKKSYDWIGKNHSEETKKIMSEQRKNTGIGEANSQYGTCWITKDGENKKIKKEVLEIWLEQNWVIGRA
jgi:hypothetical protein